ncbi:MAG: T9SS type A sorting domain-containing protein [Saprospiraceae bacterium]|nr:T9SS type A sorting domain-containing protein [Saprospiraceae bacterium]
MQRFWIIIFGVAPYLLHAQWSSIQNARNLPLDSEVTVRGRVTNDYELGKIRYMQDGTAGIAAFPGTGSVSGFESNVSLGDSIQVTGILDDYYGLLQINPITSYTVISNGVPPAPKLLSFSQISESYESQLVAFDCVVFAAGGGVFEGGATYTVRDLNGQPELVYLRSGHPLSGDIIPGASIRLVGVLSQFFDFQILPRNDSDFQNSTCFYFTEPLVQSNITTNGFTIQTTTNFPATAKILYGNTPALGNEIILTGTNQQHAHSFSNLQPGVVYWIQLEAVHNGTLIRSDIRPFVTQSLSSGQIKVFFNHSIDPAHANGYVPDGQTANQVLAETIARINGAQQTIDVAMYNNSRSDLVNALKDAHARGVRVRYVAALDATNSALSTPPPFPVIYGNELAIMHDKFLVIDADMADKAWVMGGSMNWTTQNIFTDFNNTLFIQDQSLARAYELEFEEMWGGEGGAPNPLNARFGAVKRDNTPHQFIVGEIPITLWFSPSDRTTSKIVESLYTTDDEVEFALFSFTKNDMSDALVDQHLSGREVHGIMENINDVGSEYNYLNNSGIECLSHPISGEFHHKYAVIDVNGAGPTVITGSHNWSFSAETINDENTLIIEDERIASLYHAEFQKRRQELTTTTHSPQHSLFSVQPNPCRERIQVTGVENELVAFSILNVLGLPVMRGFLQATQAIEVEQLPTGIYFIQIYTRDGLQRIPFQKI